jgi:hypothetical protein
MPEELRARLAAYSEPHNRALFRWLGENTTGCDVFSLEQAAH